MWSKVSYLRKQHDGRDQSSNHRPSDLKSNTPATTHTSAPPEIRGTIKSNCHETAAKCTAHALYFYFSSMLPYWKLLARITNSDSGREFWKLKLQTSNLRLKNPEQLQYSFICFYTFAPRSFGLALTAKNIMKVDSLRSHVAIVVTLGSLCNHHGDGNENVEKQ